MPESIYLVGGAVRDQLLGLPVTERDWVIVGSTPEQMLAAGYRQADPDFPVFLHPQTGDEYALARRETKSGIGYRGFEIDASPEVSLEQDLELIVRDKLGDPQRRMEIQEALSEVVGGKCRVKLVLATEYEPQKAANPQPAASSPAQGSAGESEMDDEEIAQIEEWAQKVGGQVIEEESH